MSLFKANYSYILKISLTAKQAKKMNETTQKKENKQVYKIALRAIGIFKVN